MFHLSKDIIGVKYFQLSNQNEVYTVVGDKVREREVLIEGKKVIEKTKVYSLNTSSKGVFANCKTGAVLFKGDRTARSYSNKLFKGELDEGFVFEEIANETAYLSCQFHESQRTLKLVESSSLIYFDGSFGYKVQFDENIATIGLVKFGLYGIEWEYFFKDLGQNWSDELRVKSILGTLENQLWVALNNHIVIALDIETGELKRHLSSINDFVCDWLPSAIPAPESMQLDERRNLLVGFMWEFYWEVNPKTGEIKFYDLTEYFKEQKIRNDKPEYVLGKNHIYFISKHDSKLGALNLETKKLDWLYIFEEDEQGIIPEILELKGNDFMLGALDRSHTLHIFEKG